jgi:hypothetical protein
MPRGFSPMVSYLHYLWLSITWSSWRRRKQRQESRDRKHLGIRYNLQRQAPSGLLPPARPHLLKSPLPSKIAPPAGHQALNTWAWSRHFRFKPYQRLHCLQNQVELPQSDIWDFLWSGFSNCSNCIHFTWAHSLQNSSLASATGQTCDDNNLFWTGLVLHSVFMECPHFSRHLGKCYSCSESELFA